MQLGSSWDKRLARYYLSPSCGRIKHFLLWSGEIHSVDECHSKLIEYFNSEYEAIILANDLDNPPSRMKCWYAILRKWYMDLGYGNLTTNVPQISRNIMKWTNLYTLSNTKLSFTPEALVKYFLIADDCNSLLIKAFIVVLASIETQTRDLHALTWSNICKEYQPDGAAAYVISNILEKTMGHAIRVRVTGRLAVRTLDRYIACFSPSMQNDRFFRKLRAGRNDDTISASLCWISQNNTSAYGRHVANKLSLPQWQLYSGNCWGGITMEMLEECYREIMGPVDQELEMVIESTPTLHHMIPISALVGLGVISQAQHLDTSSGHIYTAYTCGFHKMFISSKRPSEDNFMCTCCTPKQI